MRMTVVRQPGIDVRRPIKTGDARIGHQWLQDRRWVGAAARFDHNAIKRRAVAFITPLQHVLNGLRQVSANLAAQAAGLELDEAVLARFEELVVETDLSELIDNDSRARKFGLAKQMTKNRGLAAAEKTGENRNRDHICPHQYGISGVRVTRTRFAA